MCRTWTTVKKKSTNLVSFIWFHMNEPSFWISMLPSQNYNIIESMNSPLFLYCGLFTTLELDDKHCYFFFILKALTFHRLSDYRLTEAAPSCKPPLPVWASWSSGSHGVNSLNSFSTTPFCFDIAVSVNVSETEKCYVLY